MARSTSGTDPVEQYARDVLAGRIVAGRPVRLACERHLRDLKDGPKRGLSWDWPAAKWAIDFFAEELYLNGGEFEGEPFELHPAQQFIVGSLFGWKGADGYRRFRVAFVEMGKGNGKSPLAAGIGIYMLMADGEPRAEVYSAAVDKDQAVVLFRDAVAMVDQSPELDQRITRSGGRGKEWNLAHLDSGSFFRPIASEAQGRGKSGPRVHCGILDEIHEHKTGAMVEFIRAGTKGRRQALIFMITNSGLARESVCYDYHEYALKVLDGSLENDSFFGYVCSLDACESCQEQHNQPNPDCDQCDSWTDPAVWPKANPLLDVSITKKYLAEQVREAKGMPSKQSIVRRLNFCEWVGSEEWFILPEVWDRNAGTVSDVAGKCWGMLDLSSKNDLTAFTLVFEPGEDGRKPVRAFFWTPGDTLIERAIKDNAPYERWVEDGHLIAKPGVTIDYGWVAQKIGEVLGEFDVQAIGFDPWRIDDLRRELDDEGVFVNLIPISQGYKGMDPCLEMLEDDLLEGRLIHGDHPVQTWCMSNAVVDVGDSGMRKFSKKRARGRIDGAVTLAGANWLSGRSEESGTPWGPAESPDVPPPPEEPVDNFIPVGSWA